MSYFKQQLLKDEQILISAKIHSISLIRALFALFMLLILYKVSIFLLLLLGIFFVKIAIEDFVHYFGAEYLLTNQRLLIKRGIISLTTREVFLDRVESSEVEQNWLGRWLNFGSVEIIGIGGSAQIIFAIQNPLEFRTKLQQQLAASKSNA